MSHYIKTESDRQEAIKVLTEKPLGEYGFGLEFQDGKRTPPQNRGMHLYFTMLANALNDAGLDMRKFLKPEIDIPWTPQSIKKELWAKIQIAYCDKESTTELTRKEVSEIYEILARHLSQKHSIFVAFPEQEHRSKAA